MTPEVPGGRPHPGVGSPAHDGLDGVVALDLARDVVVVEGADAAGFLHGQLSQRAETMPVGDSAPTFLLSPQGKVEALARLSRPAPERFVIDVAGGHGETVRASLARFQLRSALTITTPQWVAIGLRGAGADAVDVTGAELDLPVQWPGGGRDLLGPDVTVSSEVPAADVGAAEAARIAFGLPVMGVDIAEGDIPHETGLVDVAVDFTKGCYRGQELVERVHSRGAARRSLARLTSETALDPGTPLVDAGGREVGEVTSAALAPAGGGGVALAQLRREVSDGTRLSTGAGTEVIVVDRVDGSALPTG